MVGSSDYILITDYYKVHIKGFSMFTADFLFLQPAFTFFFEDAFESKDLNL